MNDSEAIDRHLGRAVAIQRRGSGLSTPELALMTGMEPYELTQSEKGLRRFSGEELVAVSRALDVPLAAFYVGFEPPPRTSRVVSREWAATMSTRPGRHLNLER